ncbi:MAG: tRNA lysidine(34) synthetase TilS [Fibrobacterota bacterium]
MTGKALRFLRDRTLLSRNSAVLLAVSGGADSTALLLFFVKKLMRPFNLRLGVAHFNHGLRGKESDRDAAFVESLARKHTLPFYCEKRVVKPLKGESPEEACRRLRYAFLESVADAHGYDRIATAHHADDQAETLLMRLLTGTGLSGLSGIRAKNGRIIRPLLSVTRQEILEYLSKNKQPFRTDKSNADIHFLRNRIRHRLLPLLTREFGPHVVGTLSRLADNAAADFAVTPEGAFALLNLVMYEKTAAAIRLNRPALSGLPGILFRPVIESALKWMGASRLSARHFHSIHALLEGDANTEFQLPGGLIAVRTNDTLDICKGKKPETVATRPPAYTIETIPCTGKISFPSENAPLAYFDAEKLKGKIRVRFRKNGDRFHPLGAPGAMKLQDFLVNRKVPREERDTLPLVTCGNHIAWIPGHRISEAFKVDEKTQIMVIVKIATTMN